MPAVIKAEANPEKRFFISLLTRDIPLVAAFLDLIDNSVNAAIEPYAGRLKTAQSYSDAINDQTISKNVKITIKYSKESVEIADTAGGIAATTAKEHVFKFGREGSQSNSTDRLSVYGIGLKRAIFKLGDTITMRSDHVEGGFDLKLKVSAWEMDPAQPWTFDITPRPPVTAKLCGTKILVTDLFPDVKRRIADGVFDGELRDSVAKTYAYYLAKFVDIKINEVDIAGVDITFGTNYASEGFDFEGVSCVVTAGIGVPKDGHYRERSSGWFVLCNGRTVVSADKTPLTGWGLPSLAMPIFQPKHRPFLGVVFFVSDDPEKLPWTTTKSGINEDSGLWQNAKRHMGATARKVITFLDGRYTDGGTEITSKELQKDAGEGTVNVLSAVIAPTRIFNPPVRSAPTTMRIQFDALVKEIDAIRKYLRRPGMSGSEVGRHTFSHFIDNEVGEE